MLVGLSCASAAQDPRPDIRTALRDLQGAGFEFEADMAFRVDPYASCDGVACADLALIGDRRTVLIAPEAMREPALLRAALLDVWERRAAPRPGSPPNLARGALRVLVDGARVGVDASTQRRALRGYRQHYMGLEPAARADLPDPATLTLP